MNKLIIKHFWLFIILLAVACADPEQPTLSQQVIGEWVVDEYYVDGQSNGTGIIERFFLERDGSFLLEDDNNIVIVGDWTSTDDSITLTGTDAATTTYEFSVVFIGPEKMQLLQTITNSTIGTIEIRYLLNRTDDSQY